MRSALTSKPISSLGLCLGGIRVVRGDDDHVPVQIDVHHWVGAISHRAGAVGQRGARFDIKGVAIMLAATTCGVIDLQKINIAMSQGGSQNESPHTAKTVNTPTLTVR